MSGKKTADRLEPRIKNPTVSENSSRCGTKNGSTVIRALSRVAWPARSGRNSMFCKVTNWLQGPLFRRNVLHAGHGKYGHAVSPRRFAAQVHQSSVMAQMRVRDEDAVRDFAPCFAGDCFVRQPMKPCQLLRQVGGGLKQPTSPVARVNQPQADDQLAAGQCPPRRSTAWSSTANVRETTVLHVAQHNEVRCWWLGTGG